MKTLINTINRLNSYLLTKEQSLERELFLLEMDENNRSSQFMDIQSGDKI
jgi:hypothetical protein